MHLSITPSTRIHSLQHHAESDQLGTETPHPHHNTAWCETVAPRRAEWPIACTSTSFIHRRVSVWSRQVHPQDSRMELRVPVISPARRALRAVPNGQAIRRAVSARLDCGPQTLESVGWEFPRYGIALQSAILRGAAQPTLGAPPVPQHCRALPGGAASRRRVGTPVDGYAQSSMFTIFVMRYSPASSTHRPARIYARMWLPLG